MNPARYCATASATSTAPAIFRTLPARPASAGGRQAAVLALGGIPNLFDVALVMIDAKLDHDVDKEVEQVLDVRPGELLTSGTLLDEENQLLEGELCACGMDARDRSRMAGVDVPKIVERLFGPQLREQNPVRSHAKTGLEELLWRHARKALPVLAVVETHMVRVAIEHELSGILDRDQALIARNLPDQRLRPSRLAGIGGSGDQDVLATHDCKAHKGLVGLRIQQA